MVSPSGIPIELEEIEDFLRRNIKLKEIRQKILCQRIINKAAQERNLIVTDEEIQAEADRQRTEKRLEKATDTLAWLADQLITPSDWEAGIRDRLLTKKLSESLFSKEVEKFFVHNKTNFEQVLLYQIIVPYEKLAWEIFYQIEEDEMSFYQAAHLYDIDEKRRQHCGCEGKLNRWSFKPDLAAVIFSAQPGTIVAPFRTEQGYHILMVEEFILAELTAETSQDILSNLFNEWLKSELNYLLHHAEEKEQDRANH